MVLFAAVGPVDVALAVSPALVTLAGALVALLVARRRRRVDDTNAEIQGEDEHAKAALDVLLATIAALGERHARDRAEWAEDRGRLIAERDSYVATAQRERDWKHEARNQAYANGLRASLAERTLAEHGIPFPTEG